jgi:YD repeat-containing protein
VLGHCQPGGPAGNDPPCPTCGGGGPGPGGMPSYAFHPQKVSVLIDDVPLGYTPPVGPAINFHLSYDHRETRNPQTIDYGSVGPMWSHNWLSYVTEGALWVRLRGHGMESYLGLPFQLMSGATLVQVSNDPPRYERRLRDGTVEVFTLGDRPASQPGRRIFLTEVIDPQGHSVELTYDSSFRLVSLTDAIGQVTTFDYLDSGHPLAITKVTDPFGRVATLTYDALGRLVTVTDAAGMTSSFAYGDGDFIAAMTTPYGTTTFRHEAAFQERQIEATDPAGGTERLEYRVSHPGLPASVDASEVPTGFSAHNVIMNKYVVVYWDKLAMAAGPTLGNATLTNLLVGMTSWDGHAWARNLPQSIKRPLESRIWYAYTNMSAAGHGAGIDNLPIKIARVLEGGASQVTQMTYNAQGQVTSRIDPVGRQTNYTYATNGLDLLQVEQVRSGGTDIIQQYSNYNSQHLPGTITDAAGQDTDITYNSAGQPLTVTNAKSETTTYTYETGTNNLLTVTGPVTGATTTNTYDAYGRLESVEDADGYVVVTDYDHLNRLTQRTYPDDTTETNTYTRLDLTEQKDRLGRVTRHFYDGFGRRIATRDPAGRTISQVWCDCGAMEALVDANGNRTRWERDVQGRVTREIRADNTTDTLYTYDLSGRLKTITVRRIR